MAASGVAIQVRRPWRIGYAFTAFSDGEKDVKQQIAAQYPILAGK
jgi:hypothetical protein